MMNTGIIITEIICGTLAFLFLALLLTAFKLSGRKSREEEKALERFKRDFPEKAEAIMNKTLDDFLNEYEKKE